MSDINLDDYLGTYSQLVTSIEGLSQEQLTWKPSPEVWSVIEVLSHLVDHSIVVSFRIRDILAGTTATLPAFNQDAWVNGQYSNQANAGDILHTFEAVLHYNHSLLRRLSPTDWDKSGVNVKGETVSIKKMITLFISHVHTHLGQIERIKQGNAASGVNGSSCSL